MLQAAHNTEVFTRCMPVVRYCYHSRLPREQRGLLLTHLTQTWTEMQIPSTYNAWGWYVPGKECCAWLKLSPRTIQKVGKELFRCC